MKLSCAEIGLGPPVPIFVNEPLCQDRKRLLGQAIAKKREADWKFVWVRNGMGPQRIENLQCIGYNENDLNSNKAPTEQEGKTNKKEGV